MLSWIFNFFFLANKSSLTATAESFSLQDAQLSMVRMEREIRQANRPSHLIADTSAYPAVIRASKAIIVDKKEMTIYTYENDAPRRVSYQLVVSTDNADLYEMQRASDQIPDSEPVETPSNWSVVIRGIVNIADHNYFEVISDDTVRINLPLIDSRENISRPLELENTFTVRGKDAML